MGKGNKERVIPLFQFHKGTIRTSSDDRRRNGLLHFNSIKVRLEQRRDKILVIEESHFNSIKVRLELPQMTDDDMDFFISIP